jgi:hypothetical protein
MYTTPNLISKILVGKLKTDVSSLIYFGKCTFSGKCCRPLYKCQLARLWPSNDAKSPFQDEVANADNQIEDDESMDMCSYKKGLNQGMTCFKPRCMNSAKDLQLA